MIEMKTKKRRTKYCKQREAGTVRDCIFLVVWTTEGDETSQTDENLRLLAILPAASIAKTGYFV
jgi:hypothetical protein